jgi:CRISPR-associated protein Cas10/Csm1 subtype III-A
MAVQDVKDAAQFALAALLRGIGQFAHRAAPAQTVAESLERFATKKLERLLSHTAASAALRIAMGSFAPRNADEHLLDAAWRFAGAVEPNEGFHAGRMYSPLATVCGVKPEDLEVPLLPLTKLEFNESIFPTSRSGRTSGVQELWAEFGRAVTQLEFAELFGLVQSLASALEIFAWSVPADGYRDLSLFELARGAAAIAAALAADRPADGTRADYAKVPLLLVVGDLGGIQRFLYTVVASRAARMLRGRSLGLQLIADGLAHRILDKLGLPASNLLYNGGGKIWLLTPVSQREIVLRLAEDIDLDLNRAMAARLSFGVGCATTTLEELSTRA